MAKGKAAVITFRVDAHLARALERLPDKSAFIRTAIEKALHEPCPACGGKGVVDCDAAAWLTDVLAQHEARNCTCCDVAFSAAGPAEGPETVCGHCGPEDHHH